MAIFVILLHIKRDNRWKGLINAIMDYFPSCYPIENHDENININEKVNKEKKKEYFKYGHLVVIICKYM